MNETPQLDDGKWRVFCAIELPKVAREHVLQHIARLKEAVPDARASWGRESNLHLTLKFLGEIPQSAVAHFSEAASRTVSGIQPFSIRLEQTGIFPPHGQPRVLWVGVYDASGMLAELHARLEKESARFGFAPEGRAFHPHLTIARLRKPEGARTLAAIHQKTVFEPAAIAVSELVVIRSELTGNAPRYTAVSRHILESAT